MAMIGSGRWPAACVLLLSACVASCRSRQLPTSRAAGLDYAGFMKNRGEVIVTELARQLGVGPCTFALRGRDAPGHQGIDYDRYATANGGTIDLFWDEPHRPLSVRYRSAAECVSSSAVRDKRILPADADASVLALLRGLGLGVDDLVSLESRLHDDGMVWIGVYVFQTYRGERIWTPTVFSVVDGISGRICEIRVPRWYVGLARLEAPLANDVLASRARQGAASILGRPPIGDPTLGLLAVMDDRLCREATFASSGPKLCVDLFTGEVRATRR
jgi:hypothetical protein